MAHGRHRRLGGRERSAAATERGTSRRTVVTDEQRVPPVRTARRTSVIAAAIGSLAAVAVVAVVIGSWGRGDGSTTQALPESPAASTPASTAAPQPGTPTQAPPSGPSPTAPEQVSVAAQWVTANLPSGSAVLTDADVNAELDRLGASQRHVAVDPAGGMAVPWRDYDYIASTQGLRESSEGDVAEAIESSSLLASFGPEPSQIEIRRLEPEGLEVVQARRDAQAAAGAQLARNPALVAAPEVSALLRQGAVDPRLLILLAAAADRHELTIADFPARAGEESSLRRTMTITAIDGQGVEGTAPGTALRSWLDVQEAPFAPASAAVAEGALVIAFDIAADAPVDFLADVIHAEPLPA